MSDCGTDFKYVFGPVHSGRLGNSLGLDLLGGRICSFDCLYCEAGPTTLKTVERRAYVRAGDLRAELMAWKAQGHVWPDHVTLGGLGEPTLNSDLEEIVAVCRETFPGIPVAILTNSTLLGDARVVRGLAEVDVVLPSLDTLVVAEYNRLNRPHPSLGLDVLLAGLRSWRGAYAGEVRLETLLCAGINDSEENLTLLREAVADLRPDHVDVVTVSRPGAFAESRPVGPEVLARWRSVLDAGSGQAGESGGLSGPEPKSRIAASGAERTVDALTLLRSIRRRPQTTAQLAQALAVDAAQVAALLSGLESCGRVVRVAGEGEPFFAVARPR